MALEKFGQLTKIEQRTVLALAAERQRLAGELQEVEQAIQAQIVGAAERLKLPPDQYVIVQADDNALWLAREKPVQTTTPANEETATDAMAPDGSPEHQGS